METIPLLVSLGIGVLVGLLIGVVRRRMRPSTSATTPSPGSSRIAIVSMTVTGAIVVAILLFGD